MTSIIQASDEPHTHFWYFWGGDCNLTGLQDQAHCFFGWFVVWVL